VIDEPYGIVPDRTAAKAIVVGAALPTGGSEE
jgi:hypothetical protein